MAVEVTTLGRVKNQLEIAAGTTAHDVLLRRWISSATSSFETYLNRHIEAKSRTEQFTVEPWQRRVWVQGYPVTTVTTVKNDTQRDFTGLTVDVGDYYLDAAGGRFDFDKYILLFGPGVLQIVYTGGMAASTERMIGTIGTVSGTMTPGNTVEGTNSLARGTLVAVTSGVSITVDVESGGFLDGETLTDLTASGTVTLTAVTQEPFVSRYPDVVSAANWQVAYWFQRRSSLGAVSISSEGGSVSLEQPTFELQPGVKQMIDRHRRAVRTT